MMTSNAALIERSRQMAREDEQAQTRTCYVIRLTKSDAYVAQHHTYTLNPAHALLFDFMTTAALVALELLDLACEDFEIDSVTCANLR